MQASHGKEENLISKPRNKPLGSNWERIERRAARAARAAGDLHAATGKELKDMYSALHAAGTRRAATGKELKDREV